jgi:hypothetical protein
MKYKKYILGLFLGVLIAACCYALLILAFDRTREFQAQARAGQPIIQAIESYYKRTGSYPDSLTNLFPQYLTNLPDIADIEHEKTTGWDYHIVTNNAVISYRLRYYMGRGGVEYEPPIWFGNDEGSRKILFKSK